MILYGLQSLMMETRWYFGYGSNIDEEQMKRRCPAARAVCTGTLVDFKLVERLYADVEEAKGSNVQISMRGTRCDIRGMFGISGEWRLVTL